jgi:hypothetical protein
MPISMRGGNFGVRERMSTLKKLIWIYFLLLVLEGALRKWILPQFGAPLLLIRDPVGILIIWEAYRTQKWPRQWSIATGLLCMVFIPLMLAQMVMSGNPWFIAFYGLRSYLLPFPVAFVIGEVIDREDLYALGRCSLYLLLLNVVLEVFQYEEGPGSWLNAGAYAGAGQIAYVGGHVRASGTFSYVIGPIFFVPICAAFLFYGLANEDFLKKKKWLLWVSAGAVVLSIPVTGSRTLVFHLAATLLCVVIAAFRGVSQFGKTLKVIAPILLAAFAVSFLPVFTDATGSLTSRFALANVSEGGAEASLLGRTVIPVFSSLAEAFDQQQWLGKGMGIGSNAASKMLTGEAQFLSSESEVPRLIDELGPIVGIGFVLFRMFLLLAIAMKSFRAAGENDPLSWLFLPVTASCLFMGVLEQPTEQGFMVISVAFSIAALKKVNALPVPEPMQGIDMRTRWRARDAARI